MPNGVLIDALACPAEDNFMIQNDADYVFSNTVPHWHPSLPAHITGFNFQANPGFAGALCESTNQEAPSGWITMGFYVYVDGTNGLGNFQPNEGANAHFRLLFNGNADTLEIRDGTNSAVITLTGVVPDVWNRCVIKWQLGNNKPFMLWFNPWYRPVQLVYTNASMDLQTGTVPDVRLSFRGVSFGFTPPNFLDAFFIVDDGTAWDDVDTTFGLTRTTMKNWVNRYYFSNKGSLFRDFGDENPVLGAGSPASWLAVEEVPSDVANTLELEVGLGVGSVDTGVFYDDPTTGGPSGDLDSVANNPIGMVSRWSFKGTGVGKGDPRWVPIAGTNNAQFPHASLVASTSFTKRREVQSRFPGHTNDFVPLFNEFAAMGWETINGFGNPGGSTFVSEMMAVLPTPVNPVRYTASDQGGWEWHGPLT